MILSINDVSRTYLRIDKDMVVTIRQEHDTQQTSQEIYLDRYQLIEILSKLMKELNNLQ